MEVLLHFRDLIHFHDILHPVQEGDDAFGDDRDHFLLEVVGQWTEFYKSHWLIYLRYVLDKYCEEPQLVTLDLLSTDPVYDLFPFLQCVLHEEALHTVWDEEWDWVHHILSYLSVEELAINPIHCVNVGPSELVGVRQIPGGDLRLGHIKELFEDF